MEQFEKSKLNKVKRIPKRGHYDKATVYRILDAGFLCHVSFVVEDQPIIIPTAYGRVDDTIYLHGATKSRLLMHAQQGHPLCISVTHLDGLVLARSAFNHSMNYRSVVLFGKAQIVPESDKKEKLKIISDQILPGRWEESRQPNVVELKATAVIAFQIDTASAKIRTGDPVDEKEDYSLPVWAGVLPIRQVAGNPIPDPLMNVSIPIPESIKKVANLEML